MHECRFDGRSCSLRRANSSLSRSSTMLSGCGELSDTAGMGIVSSKSWARSAAGSKSGPTDGDTGRDDSLEESGVIGGLPVSCLPPIAAVTLALLDSCEQPVLYTLWRISAFC